MMMKAARKLLLRNFFIFSILIGVISCRESGTSPAVNPIELGSPVESEANLSCDGITKDLSFEYDADYILLDAAVQRTVDGSFDQEFWGNTLYFGTMHIPFSFGFANAKSGAKFMAMYPESVQWEDLKISEAPYPYNVKSIYMPDEEIGYYQKPMQTYWNYIKKYGAKKGDKGVHLQAKVKFRALFCMDHTASALNSGNFHFNLPLDPQTVFEEVPQKDWRKIRNPALVSDAARTNPCVNPEIVVVNPDRPAPTNGDFHYFWDPNLKAKDDAGKEFDCKTWYKEGYNYRRINPRLFDFETKKHAEIPYEPLAKLKRPWQITIVTGIQRQTYKHFDKRWILPAMEAAITAKTAQEHQKILPNTTRPGEEDLSLDKMLILLWRISMNMEIEQKNFRVEPNLISATLDGKLKHSGKEIHLNIIVGNSKPSSPDYDIFKKTVSERLVLSDIFLYEGHSGYGQSLSPSNLGIKEAVTTLKQPLPDYQIMGFFSCQSLFYYSPAQFSDLPKIKNRVWVETLGDYLDVNGNGSLGVLASLEKYLQTGEGVPFSHWAKDFANDNFMMLLSD